MASEIVFFLLGILIIALICQYIDSAVGGGYGTILVPILLILGFENKIIVPSVLLSQSLCGFASAFLHQVVGNANFRANLNSTNDKNIQISDDFKISFILASCGIFGGILAALIALNLSEVLISLYVGFLVGIMGILVLLKIKWNFSWSRIWCIGFLAAFNKGLSGGGYGPLVSTGQIIIDRNPKQAVASTSLAEAIVSISALLVYFLAFGIQFIDVPLLTCLLVGSMLSVPLAVLSVKHVPIERLLPAVGLGTVGLGIFTVIRVIF